VIVVGDCAPCALAQGSDMQTIASEISKKLFLDPIAIHPCRI
jgi:hypothetical protein